MTSKLIETLKTSIYNPKHIKNNKIHNCSSQFSKTTKLHIFPPPQKEGSNISAFYAIFLWHYIYFMLRATQPN